MTTNDITKSEATSTTPKTEYEYSPEKSCEDITFLDQTVQINIKSRWKPYRTVFIRGCKFYQTLVKYEEKNYCA